MNQLHLIKVSSALSEINSKINGITSTLDSLNASLTPFVSKKINNNSGLSFISINYFMDTTEYYSKSEVGATGTYLNLSTASNTKMVNSINDMINSAPANYFTCAYVNGKSFNITKRSLDQILQSLTYNNVIVNIYSARPLGYFNNNGQWVDLNPNMSLKDVFPNTKVNVGGYCAVKPGDYWLIQAGNPANDSVKDSCTFDGSIVSAFTPNSWGKLNWKYFVNNPDSLTDDGPVKTLSNAEK